MNSEKPRVLWVTNDLPPHSGGIQQFVANLLARTADGTTLVLGPGVREAHMAEAAAFDARAPWRTERAKGRILPTASTHRWVTRHVAEHRPDVVVLASVWPLGRIVPALKQRFPVPVLGLSHGAEAGLAQSPMRRLLHAVTRDIDVVTVISEHTSNALQPVLRDVRVERLSPGVHPSRFARQQHCDEALRFRAQWNIPPGSPVVGCVARLVARKGQDMLIDVWSDVRALHPAAHLVLVGEGPRRRRLARRARRVDGVHVVGRVGWEQLPAAYAALDVFAMPVRTRLGGLDVEGLGISLLEAQAAGLPVIAGDSGGAPETVRDPRCGTIVDGRDASDVVAALDHWLRDAEARHVARRLGPQQAEAWSWDGVALRFSSLLSELAEQRRPD